MNNKYKAEVMYESSGKTIDRNPFITVKKARGYYEYVERGGIDSIAFILLNRKNNTFGLIKEAKPPMDEIMGRRVQMITAFGGSIDSKKNPFEICQEEVKEESGYVVSIENNIHYVGKTLVSSQMNQMCWLFLVDITDIKKTEKAEYELQKEKDIKENGQDEVIFMDYDSLMSNMDWKSITIYSLAKHQNII